MRPAQRSVRLFLKATPDNGQLALDSAEAHYLATVLRLRAGDTVVAFNGDGNEWRTTITGLTRRAGLLQVHESLPPLPESPLSLTLVQAIVKSEAMDTIVQKATELGVTRIAPVVTEYSVVRLDEERIAKRLAHWARIARGACEQSGRHRPPQIDAPVSLEQYLDDASDASLRIMFDPHSPDTTMAQLPAEAQQIDLLIGPEGGFGPRDGASLNHANLKRVHFGPRILRAETAAISGCTFAQQRWGDLMSRD